MNGQDSLADPPPSAVLDTNTVLDMLLFADPAAAPLRAAVETGRLDWVGTSRMREELAGVLRRPRMGRWSPPTQAAVVEAFTARWMRLVPPPTSPSAPRCRDAADQVFIDLAWTLPAKWLLTRDRALLKLARPAARRGVQVCPPGVWATHWCTAVSSGPALTA